MIQRQEGGCDYTIGCGLRIDQLNSKTKDEAITEAVDNIGSNWRGQVAELLEVAESIDLAVYLDKEYEHRQELIRFAAAAKKEKAERAEYERLKIKYEKLLHKQKRKYKGKYNIPNEANKLGRGSKSYKDDEDNDK